MNKYETIDSFLKYIRDLELQNPGFIDSPKVNNTIYSQLTRIGVSPQDKKFRIPDNDLFNKWIKRFANKNNIEVFVSPNWQYFCQFTNDDGQVRSSKEHIKVYIPQDSTHIEKSANMIFEFLAKNNIKHMSKIGSDIRFDDIVVRLINPEDEIKLRQFLNSNKYIQEGMIPANPFLFQIDGIALACDGKISFNSTISKYITIYLQEKKRTGSLNSVGIEDFYNFIQNYFQRTFIDKTNIQNVKTDLDINGNLIGNYMNVTELILKCINSNFGYSNYIEHFNKCSNQYLMEQQNQALENYFLTAVNNNLQKSTSQTEFLITPELRQETNEMLVRIINVLKIRYEAETYLRIEKYLETGNVNYIPGDDPNLRNDLSRSHFREALKQILAHDNISLHNYINNMKNPDISHTIDFDKVSELLNFAYQGLKEMYGEQLAIKQLEKYITTGESKYLTRANGIRQVISSSSFRDDMIVLLNGAPLANYINEFLDNSNKNKDIVLREALAVTYKKYEAAYQSGASQISGTQWIISALIQLIEKGSYNGFTRDNQVRENVSTSITSNDALQLISSFYGVSNVNGVNHEIIKTYADAYASDIVMQMQNSIQY